jgi:CRP-like cAMP-binding protein
MGQEIDRDDDERDSSVKTFHKGALLFREGQASEVAYIIKKGRVAVYRIVNNKRVGLGERGPGEMVGEMGLIAAETRKNFAEALEYTEALVCDQNLLRTMLLKSPRPIQLLTGYLVERARALSGQITDRPSGNLFWSVCRTTALCWQAAVRGEVQELSYAELSRTLKDILLVSQLEIDAVFERLQKLRLVSLTDVKGSFSRTDPLLGHKKPGPAFVRDRALRLPDLDHFLAVARNMAKEDRDKADFGVDLEFFDLGDFARAAETSPDILYKKIGYREIPEELFFFHKAKTLAYIERLGLEFFRQAHRPRLTAADLERLDDIVAVDNATLQEAFSALGFHKVAVALAAAGEAAREKILKNLSKKIAAVVREEAASLGEPDEDETADVEKELLDRVKAIKGLTT